MNSASPIDTRRVAAVSRQMAGFGVRSPGQPGELASMVESGGPGRSGSSKRLAMGCGLAALMLAGWCYWLSLEDVSSPKRAPIPVTEMEGVEGHAVRWRISSEVRLPAWRWQRVGVRVWEAGRLLPKRVEEPELAATLGNGRFCVRGDSLWFSAGDGSDPRTNGREYLIQVDVPTHRAAMAAGLLLLVAAGLLWWSVPRWRWRNLLGLLFEPRRKRLNLLARQAGWLSLSLAAGCVLAGCTRQYFFRQVTIPPASLLERAGGYACYYPARWVRASGRISGVRLLEDSQPLRQVPLSVLRKDSATGVYAVDGEAVCLRSSHSPAPEEIHRLQLRVDLWPSTATQWWALFFGCIGLVLMGQHGGIARPIRPKAALGSSWWGPVLLVALCKLLVVAGDEPVAQHADGAVYAETVNHQLWSRDFDLPSHPGGFPFIAGIVAQSGLPWRLALELGFLAVCSLAARAAAPVIGSKLAAFVLFFLMAWHPWTLSGFRDFMSDPVVLVLLMGILALVLQLLLSPVSQWRKRSFFLLGGLLFLWAWCRREDPLVYLSYLGFAGVACWLARAPRWTWPQTRRAAALLAIPPLIVLTGDMLTRGLNYTHYGVFARCQLTQPGFTALMKALYRVKPEQAVPYAPVTRQSLEAACQASPTLKQYEPFLLGSNAFSATVLGQETTGIPGEFGPMLNFVLLQGFPERRREADASMAKAAREIDAALRDGRLPERRVIYPLDPQTSFWIPKLPGAVASRLREGAAMTSSGEPWGTYHHPLLQHAFDLAANRRAASVYQLSFQGEGEVSTPANGIDSVAITDTRGRWLGASTLWPSNWWDHGQAFDIVAPLEAEPEGFRLLFLRQGKAEHSLDFNLPPPSVADGYPNGSNRRVDRTESGVTLPSTGQTFSYHFKAGLLEPERSVRRARVERQLSFSYRPAVGLGLLIVFVAAFLARPVFPLRAIAGCLVLVALWFGGRAALYGLIDANFAYMGHTRFMRCVSPLYILLLGLAAATAAALLRRYLAPQAGRSR